MEKYDDFLAFGLPEGYCIVEGVNDNGEAWYNVKAGKEKNDNGEETFEESLVVNKVDYENSPFATGYDNLGFSIKGDFETYVIVESKELSLLMYTVNVKSVVVWIKKDDHVYSFISTKVISDEEKMNNWVKFLNNVLASTVIGSEIGNFEELTAEKLNSESIDVDEVAAQNSDIPYAKPNEGQHTHLDFLNKTKSSMSVFGGLFSVNQTGTEYSFQSIVEMADDCCSSELSSIYKTIAEADVKKFELEETAHDMAELFRVNVEVFDDGHDREQEILNGYIQRAVVYNKLRSFAWTFTAFCDKEGMDPAAVDFETIQEIVDYINIRDGLNYVADSFSPTLCSGDDLHVYYIPDIVPENIRSELLKIVNVDNAEQVQISEIRSLDGLRNELSYIYPAIKVIYDELESTRDRDEELLDGVCDILYAWCSMAYAAKEPIFSEDGPMNCNWGHPDNEEDWENKWKIEQLEEYIKRENEWIKQHSNDLSRNVPIVFKDKTFVFTGVDVLDEWLDILQKLTDLGGLERSAISGKTNYLVCNPMYAGESKVKHALEQRIKGKDVKIVLLDDFLKAIKMTVKSPQEQLAELRISMEKKPVEKHIKPVVRPEVSKKEEKEKLTYKNGLIANGEGYKLIVPDGFVIKEGVEDRAFVAYIPNAENPDNYLESRFVIYAGEKQENEIFCQLRTAAEYTSIIQGLCSSIEEVFTDCKIVRYENKDLPGAIIYGYDPGCLYANIFVGIDDYIQTMRVQISEVNRRNKAEYEEIIKGIFNHMTADKKVQMLKSLDAEEYIAMAADSEVATEWINSITEYVNHISIARNIQQNGIIASFKQQQENGTANISHLKKDIKRMLLDISRYVEMELIKAEAIYTLKRAQYPENKALKKMENAIETLIEFADQEVNLDEENIKVTSELAAEVKQRLKKSVADVIDILVKNVSGEMNSLVVDALTNAKVENVKTTKVIEEATKNTEEEHNTIRNKSDTNRNEYSIDRSKGSIENKSFADKKAESIEENISNKDEVWQEADKNKDDTFDKEFAQMLWEEEVEKVKELRAKAKIEYENKVKTITVLREQEKTDRINQINEENEKSIKQAEDKKKSDLLECNNKINEYKQKLQDTESQLAKTFFLNVGKKKELGQIIVHIQNKIIELNKEKNDIEKKYEDYLIEVRQNTKKLTNDIEKEIEKEYRIPDYLYEVELRYPLPESPADIERRKNLLNERREEKRKDKEQGSETKNRLAAQNAQKIMSYEDYQNRIRKALANGAMSPTELKNASGVETLQKLAAIVNGMPDVGKRISGKNILYFLL